MMFPPEVPFERLIVGFDRGGRVTFHIGRGDGWVRRDLLGGSGRSDRNGECVSRG